MTLLTTNVKDGDPNHAGLHNEERGAINARRVVFNTIATTKTANYTAAAWDSVTFDTTGGALTLTLPSSPALGDEVEYFLTAGTNTLSITGTGLSASVVVAGHGAVARWNGTAWVERQDRKTKAALDAVYGGIKNVMDPRYGAVADGTTDDFTAIKAAVVGGGDVFMPAGTYYIKATTTTWQLPAGTRLRGVPGKTVINVDTDSAGVFREFARNNGDDIIIEGLTINRVSDFPCVVFPVQAFTGFTVRNCKLNGNRDTYSTNYCHGFQLGVNNAGTTDRVRILESAFIKLSYGLFQQSASTATCTDIQVRECSFFNNYAEDLEFNSPNATTTGVRVERNKFVNNQATASGAGFAVGMAHVADGVISGNTITNYNNEGIHLEDYCTDITVEKNTLTDCGLLQGSYVQVISGCKRIKVANNSFLVVNNTNSIYCLNVLAGGTGTTPGGRTVIAPQYVIALGNTFLCASTVRGIYYETVLQGIIANNQFNGPGTVSAGTYTGPFSYAINVYTGNATVVSGNVIRGFNYGTFARSDTINAFGDGSSVTGNVFYNCLLGLSLINTAAITATGNTMYNCQYSIVLGQYGVAQKSSVVSGNNAINCTNPMSIYGTVKLTTTGTATTGSGKTLAVSALSAPLPSGTVITFSGTGVFTTSAAAGFFATSISGTLATASVASGETATVYVPYSSDGTSQRLLANNGDSATGGFGYRSSLGSGTTTARPNVAVGVGSQYFDTTLGKPIWSDGTNWKDAAGTTV